MDKISIAFVSICIFFWLIVVFFILPAIKTQDNQSDIIAKEMNCTDLGTARDMRVVRFFDCNGEIKLVKVKQ
jgi:predicted secreted protein